MNPRIHEHMNILQFCGQVLASVRQLKLADLAVQSNAAPSKFDPRNHRKIGFEAGRNRRLPASWFVLDGELILAAWYTSLYADTAFSGQ